MFSVVNISIIYLGGTQVRPVVAEIESHRMVMMPLMSILPEGAQHQKQYQKTSGVPPGGWLAKCDAHHLVEVDMPA